MRNKHLCIHAHIDLPPAETPWLGEIEPDPSAAPYRDRFDRFYHTVLGPNASSPLLDEAGRIQDFINNFAYVSFDVNPALLDWLERERPAAYAKLLEADRLQRLERGGHGGALAAPYVSLILPLESEDDRRAAVRWGLEDFRKRFERPAEGFWLPESATDDATLETLASEGVRFVLLDPGQALETRPRRADEGTPWRRCARETLDTARPYLWRSPADPELSLAVFFHRVDLDPARIYDKLPFSVSTETPLKTAREQVVEVGRRFAQRLVDSLTANDALELSHCAADGELFGFRRLNGNRALTYALDYLMREAPARLTNYGEYLDLIPPPEEVRVRQPGARGPEGGLERWCGGPRAALDALGRSLDEEYLKRAQPLFFDPREARLAYAGVLLSDDPASTQALLDEHASKHLTPDEARTAMRACEMQRWRLEMRSLWAWEAEDFADPVFLRALACAARALDLLESMDGPAAELERRFLEELASCAGKGTYRTAAEAYAKLVRPYRADAGRLLAHFAVTDHLRFSPLPGAGLFDAGSGGSVEADVRVLLRRTRKRERRMDCFSVSEISLYDRRSHERREGLAAVLHSGGTDAACWISRDTSGAQSLAVKLEAAYLKQSRDAFRETATEAFGSEAYALDALLSGGLRRAAAWLGGGGGARPFSDRASTRGSAASERRWDAASRAVPEAPMREGGGARKAFFADWLSALRRWRDDPRRTSPLAELLLRAEEAGLPADSLPLARLYREAARRSARDFSIRPCPETLDRLTELLDAAGAAGLHLPLWEIQELAWHGARGMRIGEEDRDIIDWMIRVLGISEALFLPRPAETSEA